MPILLYAVASLAYAALAWHLWRTRWRSEAAPAAATWERAAVLVPLALHAWLLYHALFLSGELRFGFGYALSGMLWLTVLIYAIESLFLPLEGTQTILLILAAVCLPLPAIFPGLATPPSSQSFEFRIHATLAMLAYSMFTMAALHAMLMTILERRLHSHSAAGSLGGLFAALPPLLSMETLLFRLIAIGFVLLTLTLATGIIYSETIFGKAIPFTHKTVFALASWVIFAALLAGRYLRGWRGRTALRWTLAGFVSLLLAYVGSRFVIEVILHRPSA